MTPQAQRIAIAEACGWKMFEYEMQEGFGFIPPGVESHVRNFVRIDQLPDYLNDLNAMHKAEKILTFEQRNNYGHNLYPAVDVGHNNSWWTCAHATAAQRAEAFLKTLGLWKSS